MPRPAKFDSQWAATMRGIFPGLTPRAMNDRLHGQQAFNVLLDDPRFYWLTAVDGRRGGNPRWRILTELGRLLIAGTIDGGQLIELAQTICQQQPRSADCVRWLKRWRRDDPPAFQALRLSETVSETIARYFRERDKPLAADALDVILENVRCMILGSKE